MGFSGRIIVAYFVVFALFMILVCFCLWVLRVVGLQPAGHRVVGIRDAGLRAAGFRVVGLQEAGRALARDLRRL